MKVHKVSHRNVVTLENPRIVICPLKDIPKILHVHAVGVTWVLNLVNRSESVRRSQCVEIFVRQEKGVTNPPQGFVNPHSLILGHISILPQLRMRISIPEPAPLPPIHHLEDHTQRNESEDGPENHVFLEGLAFILTTQGWNISRNLSTEMDRRLLVPASGFFRKSQEPQAKALCPFTSPAS